METLLTVAIILTTLAIMVQAGILVSMYLMSRRLTDKADILMTESQKLMAPLETITNNLKTVSTDLAESGKLARDEMVHVQQFLGETQQNIREQIVEIRSMVLDTVDEARTVVMRPVREYSAIASAVAAGVRTFFSGRKKEPVVEVVETEIIITDNQPAA